MITSDTECLPERNTAVSQILPLYRTLLNILPYLRTYFNFPHIPYGQIRLN